MKKILYIVVRYSVFLEGAISWNLSKLSVKEYRSQLFSTERLQQRLRLFKNITLPSVLNQKKVPEDIEIKLFILTSQELPLEHKKALEEVLYNYDFAHIRYLPAKGINISEPILQDLKGYGEEVLYATLRLDDDDALSTSFIKEIDRFFVKENVGMVVSFGLGLAGYYDFNINQYIKIVDYYSPKIGIGLCYINLYEKGRFSTPIKTIFQAGGHTKVDRKSPTILYSKEIMFLRTFYESSDSSNARREKKIFSLPPLDPEVLSGRFIINGFNNQSYYDYNANYIKGVSCVDRTYYNKRFDLIEGERVYDYILEGLRISFFSRINIESESLVVYISSQVKKDAIGYNFQEAVIERYVDSSLIYLAMPKYIGGSIDAKNRPKSKKTEIINKLLKNIIKENNIQKENVVFFGNKDIVDNLEI
ncbi:glycosyltransferase [Psychrobacter celer]